MKKRKEKSIPNTLKECRLRAGLTQKQVSNFLGLQCESRLSNWEHAKCLPNIKTILRLAKIYEVKVEDIFPESNTIINIPGDLRRLNGKKRRVAVNA